MVRRFHLARTVDVSGTSGIGDVAEGVEFTNGMVALTFISPFPCINIYANIKAVQEVHGHGWKTKVVFEDPPSPNGE